VVELNGKLSRRLAEQGASDIETINDTHALQGDSLRGLTRAALDLGHTFLKALAP
jgi:hypothetical protein